jgi:RNase P/RNase MRP subunit p29
MMMIHSAEFSAEFIGAQIKVIKAANKSLEGMEGSIVDETKSTFKIINTENKEKILLKKGAVFLISNQRINGDDILRRPEERIKLKK